MTTELRSRGVAKMLYVQALSNVWHNTTELYEPGVWLDRDPEIDDKMMRDADIAQAVTYRQHLIAGRQWDLQAKDPESPTAELAVQVGTALLQELRGFTAARCNLAIAFLSGQRWGRVHGTTKDLTIGDGVTRRWWIPTRIEDQDKRQFRKVPDIERGELRSAHWQQWDVGQRAWRNLGSVEQVDSIRHTYNDTQSTLGYGRGLREALGWWWYAKENVFAETLQACERYAQGLKHVQIDGLRDASTGLPNTEVIRSYVREIEKQMARHVLVTDSADKVSVIANSGEGWQLLKDVREELRGTIRTLVLQANVTTAADKGGSYALASEQADSTQSLIEFDRELLGETLTDHLLGCVWWHNWPNLVELGIEDQVPRFNVKQEKNLDPQARATVASTLSGMGVPLAADDVYEQTGFRKPKEGEDIIEGRPAAIPGAFGDPLGSGAGAGAFPFKARR